MVRLRFGVRLLLVWILVGFPRERCNQGDRWVTATMMAACLKGEVKIAWEILKPSDGS